MMKKLACHRRVFDTSDFNYRAVPRREPLSLTHCQKYLPFPSQLKEQMTGDHFYLHPWSNHVIAPWLRYEPSILTHSLH